MKTHELLKYYRELNQLTQESLAEALYISRQAVSKWERGEAMPDIENIIQLSDLYEISIDQLLRGSSYLPKPYRIGENKLYLKLLILSVFAIFIGAAIGDTSNTFVFIIVSLSLILLYASLIKEGQWIIRRDRFVVQSYDSILDRILSLVKIKKCQTEYHYKDILSLEYDYIPRLNVSFRHYSVDYFYLILKTRDAKEYRLRVPSSLSHDIPSLTDYLIKKGVTIIDKRNIVKAALSSRGIYNTVHEVEEVEPKRL